MIRFKFLEQRRGTRIWIALVLLTVVMFGVSVWLAGPSPPHKIVFATGQEGGGYDTYGQQYQTRLRKLGLKVELVNTNGSIDNLHRLVDGEVDVAFVQAGTYRLVDDPQEKLRGLVAVYLEPLWVFYRGSSPVHALSDLKGRPIPPAVAATITVGLLGMPGGAGPLLSYSTLVTGRIPTVSIGPEQSGTEAVARRLLKAHGITGKNAQIVNLDTMETEQGLKDGSVDVALIISSYRDPAITELLARQDLQLMSFHRQDIAHSRQFPYLNSVRLGEGLLDLEKDIPRQEKTLLAPAALLVCRQDLHPRVIELILKAARATHSPGSLIDPANRFPTLEGVDVPIHETAETYMKSGESLLTQLLPYWGVRLVLQMRLLILPLLAIWLPFLKVVPMIYNYRVNRLLNKHYAALRELESTIGQANHPDELRDQIERLEHLRSDMETLSRRVPAPFQRDLYQWRLHVALVLREAQDRLNRLEGGQGEPGLGPVSTILQSAGV
jgi:TRAP-type uncharacterized transport system substrate-binding protein